MDVLLNSTFCCVVLISHIHFVRQACDAFVEYKSIGYLLLFKHDLPFGCIITFSFLETMFVAFEIFFVVA